MSVLRKVWEKEWLKHAGDYPLDDSEHGLWCAFKAGLLANNHNRRKKQKPRRYIDSLPEPKTERPGFTMSTFKEKFSELNKHTTYAWVSCLLPTPPLQLEESGKFKVGWGKHEYGDVVMVGNVHRDNKTYDGWYVRTEMIEEHCLSKSVVRKAIRKAGKGRQFRNGEPELNKINYAVWTCLDELLKELRLEE